MIFFTKSIELSSWPSCCALPVVSLDLAVGVSALVLLEVGVGVAVLVVALVVLGVVLLAHNRRRELPDSGSLLLVGDFVAA